MALSSLSSSSHCCSNYDVFLSFRGEDTRDNFTSHLYAALCRKHIKTFIDDEELRRGDEISPALLNAIKGSKISVIIFSKNYASSRWCLNELVKILHCHNINGQMVIPVFYHVDPSHVRNQDGSFGDAFVDHENQFKEMTEKVLKWRAVLTQASNLSGWASKEIRSEAQFVDLIVKDVLEKLEKITVSTNSDGLIGINPRIEQIKSLLCMGLSDTVELVGIWGMGGIGKTTLATALFNRVSFEFEGNCFIANVRSKSETWGGLQDLKKKIPSTIVGDKHELEGSQIPQYTKERVRRMKVFIVLDDVNKVGQLNDLVGGLDRYGPGSRIVITTRDKGVLEKYGVNKIYTVDGLKNHEAFELFCNYAFKEYQCPEDLEGLSWRLVKYVKGNPLALKVLGSSFRSNSKPEWENALDNLNEICSSDIYDIYGVLKISFNELRPKEKSMFLDIACFLEEEKKDFVTNILDDSKSYGLDVLIDKSLVTLSSNRVKMHDLLQEMGQEIVCKESEKEPSQRSRVWYHKDVRHVLKKNKGTDKIEDIFLDLSETKDFHIASGAFANMPNLRLLKFYMPKGTSVSITRSNIHLDQGLKCLPKELRYLHWHEYPLKTLPFDFKPKNLIELHLPYSKVEQLWEGKKKAFKLKSIDLCHSRYLIRMPDLSETPNLERVILWNCTNLVCFPFRVDRAESPLISWNVTILDLSETAIEEVPSSIECLAGLQKLRLSGCTRLKRISTSICKLKSLLELWLNGCINLGSFPQILEKMEFLKYICLEWTAITELPSSIENLQGLERLDLRCCFKLDSLPHNIGNLKSLEYIYANRSAISQLPSSILDSKVLKQLWFTICRGLVSLPPSSSSLSSLVWLNFSGCALTAIPQDIGLLSSLEVLNLSGNHFVSLPTSIKQLSQLEFLCLSNCNMLRSLPELPLFLNSLDASNCRQLQSLPEIPPYSEELDTSILERLSNVDKYSWEKLTHEAPPSRTMDCVFTNCMKLKEQANFKILADSQLRFQRMAIASLRLSMYGNEDGIPAVSATILLPGSAIPSWFKNQSSGSSITLQLPRHCCSGNLIGFAFCAVFEFEGGSDETFGYLKASCRFEVKTPSKYIAGRLVDMHVESVYSDHVMLGFNPIWDVGLPDGNHPMTVSFKFITVERYCYKVKCWGVCPVFANPSETNPNMLTPNFVAKNEIRRLDDKAGLMGTSNEKELETSADVVAYLMKKYWIQVPKRTCG